MKVGLLDVVTVVEPEEAKAKAFAWALRRVFEPHLHAYAIAAPVPEARCELCSELIGDGPAHACGECGLVVCDACR